ncbi:MAG: T9SS type A sorting domain-containing protein [Candidatus Eisenbacteria bacterium]
MASPTRLALTFSAFALCAATIASAIPAANMRSGKVEGTNLVGLTTVPLFGVPTGSRFVLTDLTWTLGKYQFPPSGTLVDPVAVWIQDNSNNIRWYEGLVAGSATPHIGWTTGIVFEENTLATLGVSNTGSPITWSGSWSGYVEANSVSAVESTPDQLGFEVFPNPSGSRAVLQFRLARDGKALISIYDSRGRKIRSLADQVRSAGWNAIEWDGRDDKGRAVRGGTYFARLEAAEGTKTEKVIHIGER